MLPTNRKPTTPGELLQEQLDELGISPKELEFHIRASVRDVLAGMDAVSCDLAFRLGAAFNQSPQFWLNAELARTEWLLKTENRHLPGLHPKVQKRLVPSTPNELGPKQER